MANGWQDGRGSQAEVPGEVKMDSYQGNPEKIGFLPSLCKRIPYSDLGFPKEVYLYAVWKSEPRSQRDFSLTWNCSDSDW